MWEKEPGVLLNKLLPAVSRTEEIQLYIQKMGFNPRFEIDLPDPKERLKISTMKKTMLEKGISGSEWAGDVETLANILYYDICERQSDAIAAEVIRNDELGAEYFAAIFIHLVDNYIMVGKDYQGALERAGIKPDVYEQALDIVFASRFGAFERYDIWDAGERSNEEIRQSPDRAMLSLLNNDICMGAFWDDRALLKNDLIRERLQTAINLLHSQNFDFMSGWLTECFGKYGESFLDIAEKSHATLRLIDIAEGKCNEISSFSFVCDSKKLDTLSSKIQKVTSMIKIKEFVETTEPSSKKSLNDLVSELQKLRGPKQNGERIG